ncbi:MAG: Oxidoreductase [uncultured Sulfurovum sp.]|uniref:Oxidoreductase n=1 Tax=uncultured Sulfurovum sp. TaxID=269237 RepID=A0A6S6UFE9_9BACT|nr:MAG: Oxidoreductase [uncultured Sulfurovum sp.]
MIKREKMKKIWLIGAGPMAQDYIKVIEALKTNFIVIGRGEETAQECEKATGCKVVIGGLDEFLDNKPEVCSHAIVSVGVEKLYQTTKELLNYGVKNILVEKPAGLHREEFEDLVQATRENDANVFVAYNRRFYASVLHAKKIIKEDGGVTSFNFEFTEWGHVIAPLKKAEGVKEKWFLGNSTHVVDLAFFLGGNPKEICSFTNGNLEWHPTSSVFSGAGKSDKNALFSYHANWESAGRWSVEMLTKEHKLILRPMEKLQIQKRGAIAQDFVEEIDYALDDSYKPGLYLQTKNFLEENTDNFCAIEDQLKMYSNYAKMAGYSN